MPMAKKNQSTMVKMDPPRVRSLHPGETWWQFPTGSSRQNPASSFGLRSGVTIRPSSSFKSAMASRCTQLCSLFRADTGSLLAHLLMRRQRFPDALERTSIRLLKGSSRVSQPSGAPSTGPRPVGTCRAAGAQTDVGSCRSTRTLFLRGQRGESP